MNGIRSSSRLKQFFQASASIVCCSPPGNRVVILPHYLFPPVQQVLARTVKILFNWPELLQVLETAGGFSQDSSALSFWAR